jgi:hypothetical protein
MEGSLEEKAMSPTHVTPENANSATPAELATRPRVVAAADANDVMREQLEYLIEHAQDGICGCGQCQRYLRARAVLMEMFADSAPTALVKKASRA